MAGSNTRHLYHVLHTCGITSLCNLCYWLPYSPPAPGQDHNWAIVILTCSEPFSLPLLSKITRLPQTNNKNYQLFSLWSADCSTTFLQIPFCVIKALLKLYPAATYYIPAPHERKSSANSGQMVAPWPLTLTPPLIKERCAGYTLLASPLVQETPIHTAAFTSSADINLLDFGRIHPDHNPAEFKTTKYEPAHKCLPSHLVSLSPCGETKALLGVPGVYVTAKPQSINFYSCTEPHVYATGNRNSVQVQPDVLGRSLQ
jgi:hypothetical protein